MLNPFKAFKSADAGASTLDWAELTNAIVGLGMVVMTTIGSGITGLGDAVVDDQGSPSAG